MRQDIIIKSPVYRLCKTFYCSLLVVFLSFCASGGKEKEDSAGVKASSNKGKSSKQEKKEPKEDISDYAGGGSNEFVYSMNGNPHTGFAYNKGKAKDVVKDIPANSRTTKNLETLITAQRLAGEPLSKIMASAKRYVVAQAKRTNKYELDENLKLELGIAAMESRNYSMALLYFGELLTSKNAQVKSRVYNALGLLELRAGRIAEATGFWKEALKLSQSNKAAALNIGFTSLKYGDITTARRYLAPHANNWYVQHGLLAIDRNVNGKINLDGKCKDFMDDYENNPVIFYNCGVYEYQNKNNFSEAKKLIGKSKSMKGGEKQWSGQASQLISEISKKEREHQAKAAKQKKASRPPPKKGTENKK